MDKKILIILIAIVVLVGFAGSGYYYWWRGTPEYSISQIKKAITTHNPKLGLKYVDTDAIFENLWTDIKGKLISETSEAKEFEELGMMLGLQLAEGMKPTMKEQLKKGIESWFLVSTEEKSKEATSTKENLELGTIWQKDLKIKKQDDSAYIELPDNVKIIFTKKEEERYWVISKIEGFALGKEFQQTATEKSEQKGKPEEIIIEKNIGEEIELATLKFTVNKTEEKQKIGKEGVAKENAKFIVIDLNITNITKSGFTFFPDDGFRLVDNQERQFTAYEDTIGNVENYLDVRELAPSIIENGVLVYEIPKDATNYSLVVGKNGTNEIYKVILK